MAQYDFGTIDPNTKSGTALASDLNSYRNAVNSMHSGSAAPSYITAGMMWVDTTSADYEVKLYDGAQSITVAIIDATNNVARVAVDPAETSYITSTTSAQIRHVIASTNIFTTRSTGIQFNLASPTITDNNSNELVSFTTTASAVNQIDIANAATGGAVNLSAVGTDTNISIALTPKGTGGVGIGTTSPAYLLHVQAEASPTIASTDTTNTVTTILNSSNTAGVLGTATNHPVAFVSNNSERMRLDSAGNVLVGKTDTSASTAGGEIFASGLARFVRSAGDVLNLNRLSTDGIILSCLKDGTAVGSLGTTSSSFWIGAPVEGLGVKLSSDDFRPTNASGANSDNVMDLGDLTVRWDDVYATNGTIQTSDRNEKQDIEELNEAEHRVALVCKGLMRKYRWKSAVAEKGDDARIHFGIIAQDLQAAFVAEGLDAGRYAMFIHSTWVDEETGEERSRMGVRYSELLAFMIAVL